MEKGVIELLILGDVSRGLSSSDVIESGERDLSLTSSLEAGHFSESMESTLNLSTCFWAGGDDDEVTVDDFGDDRDEDIFCGDFSVWESEFVSEFDGLSLLKAELVLVVNATGCIFAAEDWNHGTGNSDRYSGGFHW